jgi:hypothetical protein
MALMALSHRDLWDTRHVKSELAIGAMPEAKLFLYFLAITTFDWLQLTAFRIWPNPVPLSLPAEFDAWFGLGITVVGVIFLFLCNGGGQGKDFLYRYFPLAVVVGWKFVVAMIVASSALSFALAGQSENVTRWSAVALGCLGNVLMFLRIGQHLKALSRDARSADRSSAPDGSIMGLT